MKNKYLTKTVFFFLAFCINFIYAEGTTSEYLFSSESVTEGHPDKLCDQISDAVLDEILRHDPEGRVACETVATKGTILITGEITTSHFVDVQKVARRVLRQIGYTKPEFGISDIGCAVINIISEQSPDIAQGVDMETDHEQGAGDQGLMFGYACRETPELMPLPISLAHRLTKRLAEVRKKGLIPQLRPDGKSQVTIRYIDGKPREITTVIINTQHDPEISHEHLQNLVKELVITPVCQDYLTQDTKYIINGTGKFVIGGPEGDSGLTGRKIIVDTYGGTARHGGGAFSGKDPSKVDRSAAYMARHIAKNIVAANLADKCEVQLAYCIGVADPVSVYVDTFGTAKVDVNKIEHAIRKVFPLKPAQIIKYLNLKTPIYQKTAAYGHFGREDEGFYWENTNKIEELKKAIES
jgi:S-adenosylmethionine synthetase